MITKQNIKFLIYFSAVILILSGAISYVVSKQNVEIINVQRLGTVSTTGTFPAALNNFQDDDVINAGDWNNIEYAIGETGTTSPATLTYKVNTANSANLSYTGHLTITSATTTSQTITNLWNTTGTIGTLSLTNALGVASGGSGATTLTGILLGNGTSAFTATTTIGTNYLPAFGYGSVTSVAMTVPTGLTISGSPITTSGTLGLTLTSGYNIPLTASTTDWNSFWQAPSTRITDGTGLTWSSNTLNCDTASGSVQGCLASADWTTFNNKQATITDGTNLTFSGATLNVDDPFSITKLTATNASTTNATLTNFWSTNGTITTLNSTNGTITNASTTNLTVSGGFWGNTGVFSGTLSASNLSGTNTGNQVVPANEAGAANNFLTAYNNTTGAWTKAQPTWANIDKTTSSLSDITTRAVANLSDGSNVALLNAANAFTATSTMNGYSLCTSGNGLCVGGGAGVSSLNTFTGALSVLGTSNQITVTNSTPNITLSLPTSVTMTNASTTNLTVNSSANINSLLTVANSTSNNILTGLGLSGTPSYSFTGDTDTGMYNNSANQIGFSGGGNVFTWNGVSLLPGGTAMAIGSSGNSWNKIWVSNGVFLNATSTTSFFLPIGGLTLTATGQIAINTTQASSSIKFFDGTATRALYDLQPRTITIASSTWTAANGVGTSTIPLGVAPRASTYTKAICWSDVGTGYMRLGDNTNYANYDQITTTSNASPTTLSSNNTFTYLEKMAVQVWGFATAPNYLTCTFYGRQDAD